MNNKRLYKYPRDKKDIHEKIKSHLVMNNWIHICEAEIISVEKSKNINPVEVHMTLYIEKLDITVFWNIREEINEYQESERVHQTTLDKHFKNKKTSVCIIRWDFSAEGFTIFPTWEPHTENGYGPGDVKKYLSKYLQI